MHHPTRLHQREYEGVATRSFDDPRLPQIPVAPCVAQQTPAGRRRNGPRQPCLRVRGHGCCADFPLHPLCGALKLPTRSSCHQCVRAPTHAMLCLTLPSAYHVDATQIWVVLRGVPRGRRERTHGMQPISACNLCGVRPLDGFLSRRCSSTVDGGTVRPLGAAVVAWCRTGPAMQVCIVLSGDECPYISSFIGIYATIA